jgi:hypothetical protein
VVPPDSHRISRARCYLGTCSGDGTFSGTGLSPSPATPSRGLPLTTPLSHSPPGRQTGTNRPTTPNTQPLPGITCVRFSLLRFRSPLLTESLLFSLPVGTEMFHFPTFPPHALCVQARVTPHDWCGVPPFGHPRINARLAAPRGLTQPPTSFIGSWCPGIHRVPLTTCTHKNTAHPPPEGDDCAALQTLLQSQKMLASTVQFSTNNQTPPPAPARPHTTHAGGTRTRRPRTRQPTPAPHPRHTAKPEGITARSLRTQQRAYNPDTATTPIHTPPQERSTGSRPQPAAELVSVPPSSTTPDTPRPPGRGEPSRPGHGSGTATQRANGADAP